MAWTARAKWVALLLYGAGAGIAAVSLTDASPITVNVSSLVLALAFVATDLSNASRGGLTAITVFSLISAATAFANIVGLSEADGPRRDLYFLYVAENYQLLAAQLQWAQAVFPVLGFWALVRIPSVRGWMSCIPEIRSRVSPRLFLWLGVGVSLLVTVLNAAAPDRFVGTITHLLRWTPIFVTFALARMGEERDDKLARRAALMLALTESLRALMFDYLRAAIATPFFAYGCGAILGARSLRPLARRHSVPILAGALLFVHFYGLLGESRGRYGSGLERLQGMRDHHARRSIDPDPSPQQTVLARLTSFNQLSQIGRVVERDGFYEGETFKHLSYAFIPRFLWPEKPLIALGAWYAVKIDQGFPTTDGWYTTSINMTQAGELYLNFGWPAVPIGLLLYGFLLAVFWSRARLWESDSLNVIGGALALQILWMVLGAHGEFTVFVSLLAIYIVLLVTAWGLEALTVGTWLARRHGFRGLFAYLR